LGPDEKGRQIEMAKWKDELLEELEGRVNEGENNSHRRLKEILNGPVIAVIGKGSK
jgi:hypothetical protein